MSGRKTNKIVFHNNLRFVFLFSVKSSAIYHSPLAVALIDFIFFYRAHYQPISAVHLLRLALGIYSEHHSSISRPSSELSGKIKNKIKTRLNIPEPRNSPVSIKCIKYFKTDFVCVVFTAGIVFSRLYRRALRRLVSL